MKEVPRRGPEEGKPVRRVEAIETVRLEVRPPAVEGMADFYGRVLGLDASEPGEDALAYRVGKLEIRVRTSKEARVPMPRRRLLLEVHRLSEVTARLREEGIDYHLTHEVGFGQPRVLVRDPAGHRLGLKQVHSF
jgi:catechol-2,3-dioxygenase